MHITSDNANAGLAGQYVVKECDSALENEYLPDEEYVLPMILKDAVLHSTGDQKYNILYDKTGAHKDDIYGDINMVNGVAWPMLPMDRMTYTFRFLGVAISRAWFVKFLAVSNKGRQVWLPFWIIGTDGGPVKDMIRTYSLHQDVAERYNVLVNFNPDSKAYPPLTDDPDEFWEHVYLVNDIGDASGAPPSFCKSHLLARFDIGVVDMRDKYRGVDYELARADAFDIAGPPGKLDAVLNSQNLGVPSMSHPFKALRNLMPAGEIDRQIARAENGEYDRSFDFGKSNGHWTINNCDWADEGCRIIANPPHNGYELWHFKSGGGWHHPVHIHMIDFLVLRRKGGDSDIWTDYNPLQTNGDPGELFRTLPATSGISNGLRPWEVDGAKDVVNLGPGNDIWVLTLWGPNDGDYMFHCHNLVHEDTDMMLAAGVGRTATVDGVLVFNPDGSRNDFELNTLDQDEKYYDSKGIQIAASAWAADSNAGMEGIFGAPYSPQYMYPGRDTVLEHSADLSPGEEYFQGQIETHVRAGTGDRARPMGAGDITYSGGRMSELYMCSEVCKGSYAFFYPIAGSPQLEFREGFESDTSNPIHKNIWATSFEPSEPATRNGFTKTLDSYTSHEKCSCASAA